MKPEDARRVMERHRRTLTPPEDQPKSANPLMDAFQQSGFKVVHE